MSREGGNVTTIATKSPSQYEITLPIQNRSPSTKSPSRFAVKTLKKRVCARTGRVFLSEEGGMVAPTWSWEGEEGIHSRNGEGAFA